jgi:uncharacterized protein YdeI (YjbR/CyaY-like superfamily)
MDGRIIPRVHGKKQRALREALILSSMTKNRMNPKPAEEESEPRVPMDLRKALAAAPMAKAEWRDLTQTARRDSITWIDSAKQPKTRRRRIERTCSMLAAGKRRP